MKKKCCGKYALNSDISTESAIDKQIGGNHYKQYQIQPIEFIMANDLNFIQGNVIKYICRYENKNGLEDLDKVIHYCELAKDLLKNKK